MKNAPAPVLIAARGGYVDTAVYRLAVAAYNEERYESAVSLAITSLENASKRTEANTVPLVEAFVLVAKCYAYARSSERFYDWISGLDEAGYTFLNCPRLEQAHLLLLSIHAKWTEALEIADLRVRELSVQEATHLPDLAAFLWARGKCRFALGEVYDAIRDCESAYVLYSIVDDGIEKIRVSGFLGGLYRATSDYSKSLIWNQRALEDPLIEKMPRKRSTTLLNIGVTHYKTGDYLAALAALDEAFEIGLKHDLKHRQCFSNIARGNVFRLIRDFESARKCLHSAYAQAQQLAYPREEALSLEFLGDVYRDENQHSAARRFYARAMSIAEQLAPSGDLVMELKRRLGECLLSEGKPALAAVELEAARVLAEDQGDRYELGIILRLLAASARAQGDVIAANEQLSESVAVLRQIGARHEAGISLLALSEVELEQCRSAEAGGLAESLTAAWAHATAALDTFVQVDVAWWTKQAHGTIARLGAQRAEQGKKPPRSRGWSDAQGAIIHTSQPMQDILQLTDIFAGSLEPVLITGETGTGKELIAQRIHERSERASGPLVTVNVAAIPPTVFEREFFGHVRGAFSGADRDQPGYAAQADGGTLFLDEIGELPLELQPKLLRLLQEGTYRAIGDPKERKANVRLVAATNADLARLVTEGRFRPDLWYRLKILELHLPPVRDRIGDVTPLMRHFLSLAAGTPIDPADIFDRPSLVAAERWSWPGNVREIAMIARRAYVEHRSIGGVRIELADGDQRLVLTGGRRQAKAAAGDLSADHPQSINDALRRTNGNRQEAARMLGMSRSTFYRRLQKLDEGQEGA